MTENQGVTQASQDKKIQSFKKKFFKEYGVHLYVYSAGEPDYRIDLKTLEECTLVALKKSYPVYNYMKHLRYRTREKAYITHCHVMSYIAHNEGYTKTSIAKFLLKNHATVINSCKQVDNALFTKDKLILTALNNILKEIETYVGIVPKNFESQLDSKPSVDPIWDKARNFIKANN